MVALAYQTPAAQKQIDAWKTSGNNAVLVAWENNMGCWTIYIECQKTSHMILASGAESRDEAFTWAQENGWRPHG